MAWRRVTTVLEAVQNISHNVADCHLMVPHLSTLLAHCLEREVSEEGESDYTQQLVLTLLLDVTTALTDKGVSVAKGKTSCCRHSVSSLYVVELLCESHYNVEGDSSVYQSVQ